MRKSTVQNLIHIMRQFCFRCRKLDSLDLSECDHLMHPLVFRMWQNLTSNVTSVCLESTAATDAIVQVSGLNSIIGLKGK